MKPARTEPSRSIAYLRKRAGLPLIEGFSPEPKARLKPALAKPFAHIPGVAYPDSLPEPAEKPLPLPKEQAKPRKEKQPLDANPDAVSIRKSPLGFKYAFHPDHA